MQTIITPPCFYEGFKKLTLWLAGIAEALLKMLETWHSSLIPEKAQYFVLSKTASRWNLVADHCPALSPLSANTKSYHLLDLSCTHTVWKKDCCKRLQNPVSPCTVNIHQAILFLFLVFTHPVQQGFK